MNFSQLISNIFGSDWMNNLVNAAEIVAAAILVIVTKMSGKKLSLKEAENKLNVNAIKKGIEDITKLADSLSKENKLLAEKNAELSSELTVLKDSFVDLGNIISVAFMTSKAISGDAKVAISSAVASLKEKGVKLELAEKVVIAEEQNKVEEVQELIEEAKVEAEQDIKEVEDTNTKSLELYNEILDNVE